MFRTKNNAQSKETPLKVKKKTQLYKVIPLLHVHNGTHAQV